VGWLGGLLIWVSAMAVLAPLNLGGYEVTSEARVEGQIQTSLTQTGAAGAAERLRRSAAQLTPVYGVLTIILSFGLLLAGEEPLVAVIHAMSTMATSGITPVDGLAGRPGGHRGRGADRGLPSSSPCRAGPSAADSTGHGPNGWRATGRRGWRASPWWCCPRFCSCATGSVRWRSRRWPISATRSQALWGSAFTVLSFLTTTGFVSDSWVAAQTWSGLQTPGLLLVGLVLMGGGVATTAGGMKLLRVYALYKHGVREMGKLIYPHSVGGAGRLGRRIRREGAYIAWIFFMLFILTLAAVMLALAATGLGFRGGADSVGRGAQHHRTARRSGRGGADQLHRAQRSGEN
jgi:trk system potassium uptake protein TrkH